MHGIRILAGAALVFTLAAPSGAFDLAEIKTRGTLRVIAATGEQPEEFSFTPGPNPGFEREMLEGFARVEHLRFEVLSGKDWEDRIPALLRDEGDVVIALTDTEARRKLIAFTTETFPTRDLVVTHKPHRPVSTLNELRKQRVGVVTATSWAQAAAEAGVRAAKIEAFTDLDPLLDALKAGRIDATVLSISDFTLAAKRHPGLEAGVFLGAAGHQAWGIRKEDPALAKALNAYIDGLRKSSAWSRLVVKYFGEQALAVLGRAEVR